MQTPVSIVPEWYKRCHLILLYAGNQNKILFWQSAGNLYNNKLYLGSSETICEIFSIIIIIENKEIVLLLQ